MIRVVVVDDQPLMRVGIVSCLEDSAGIRVIGSGDLVADVAVSGRAPDAVVLSSDDLAAIDPAPSRRRWSSAALVAYVSSAATGPCQDAMTRGVAAIAARELGSHELVNAIRKAASGETCIAAGPVATRRAARACDDLTSRECDVLRVVASGRSNRDVATALEISEHTVKSHLHSAMRKLDVDTRAAAVRHATLRALI